MWIRKTDLEIKNFITQKELEKKSLHRPILFGTIFELLFIILFYFGFREGSLRTGFFSFQIKQDLTLKLYLQAYSVSFYFLV